MQIPEKVVNRRHTTRWSQRPPKKGEGLARVESLSMHFSEGEQYITQHRPSWRKGLELLRNHREAGVASTK